MTTIPAKLQAVLARIETAARVHDRAPGSVGLLAVSKTWPATFVREAAAAGQKAFGENYVQEGIDKIHALAGQGLEWHFIGPLQSNKTRQVAQAFDWVHSIDRFKTAERLAQQRPETLPPLNVCVQVNISGEDSKSGVAPEEAPALSRRISALPRIALRGLMAIPAPASGFAEQRAPFARLRALLERLVDEGLPLDTLSMGMSDDIEAAVAEGATLVRVGTAIFGKRDKTARN